MNRFAAELRRLYQLTLPGDEAVPLAADDAPRLLWVSLRGAEAWPQLRRVWQAVQTELGWPAPAIAVSGEDAFELWFSLARPVDAAAAGRLLTQLAQRHLEPRLLVRLRQWPGQERPPSLPGQAREIDGETRWSAFVAADLAPVFAETPWLDIQPGEEGQAELLAGLKSIQAEQWQEAWQHLVAAPATGELLAAATALGPPASTSDPRLFLEQVMQDPQVALALRIEAAKALLQLPRAR